MAGAPLQSVVVPAPMSAALRSRETLAPLAWSAGAIQSHKVSAFAGAGKVNSNACSARCALAASLERVPIPQGVATCCHGARGSGGEGYRRGDERKEAAEIAG